MRENDQRHRPQRGLRLRLPHLLRGRGVGHRGGPEALGVGIDRFGSSGQRPRHRGRHRQPSREGRHTVSRLSVSRRSVAIGNPNAGDGIQTVWHLHREDTPRSRTLSFALLQSTARACRLPSGRQLGGVANCLDRTVMRAKNVGRSNKSNLNVMRRWNSPPHAPLGVKDNVAALRTQLPSLKRRPGIDFLDYRAFVCDWRPEAVSSPRESIATVTIEKFNRVMMSKSR